MEQKRLQGINQFKDVICQKCGAYITLNFLRHDIATTCVLSNH